jgi:hypothetical protein
MTLYVGGVAGARFIKADPIVTQWCAGRGLVNAARAHWITTGRSLTLALVIQQWRTLTDGLASACHVDPACDRKKSSGNKQTHLKKTLRYSTSDLNFLYFRHRLG